MRHVRAIALWAVFCSCFYAVYAADVIWGPGFTLIGFLLSVFLGLAYLLTVPTS